MSYTTNTVDSKVLASAKEKALRLCKLNKCSLLDLIIVSIDVQAEIKKLNNNKK